jgi:hypothetical protein
MNTYDRIGIVTSEGEGVGPKYLTGKAVRAVLGERRQENHTHYGPLARSCAVNGLLTINTRKSQLNRSSL